MATYRIYRMYDVPGESQIEATERMMQALTIGVEKDFHVFDRIRLVEDPPDKSVKVNLEPPKGWKALLLGQLLGRAGKLKR